MSSDVKGVVIYGSQDPSFDIEREIILDRHLDIQFDVQEVVSTTQFVIEPYDPDVKVVMVPKGKKRRLEVNVIQLDKD